MAAGRPGQPPPSFRRTGGSPGGLPAEDPCQAATDPAAWIGDCCCSGAIWTMRPGLVVPAGSWVAAVLHAAKTRLLGSLLSQKPVPLHRTLRGHISPKRPNGLWLSRSAVRGEVLPASTGPGTWRHCLMWRITGHRLRGLSATPAGVWQAGTLHVVQHAPWSHGVASRLVFAPAADDFGETVVLILDLSLIHI